MVDRDQEHGAHQGHDAHAGEHHAPHAAKVIPPGPAQVTATHLNIRSAPHIAAGNIVMTIAHGATVDVQAGGARNGFYEVRVDGNTLGWASGRYLDHGPAASGNAAVHRILGGGAAAAPAVAAGAPAHGNSSLSSGHAIANPEAPHTTPHVSHSKFKLTLLVGSAYQKGEEQHRYGHVALRVQDGQHDYVYDYGRYGNTWGIGDSQGEGMLRVWTSFSHYIAEEEATTRTTTAYRYDTTSDGAKLVEGFFSDKTKSAPVVVDRGFMKQYRISDDYDAMKSNCTTLSVTAAQLALPSLDAQHGQFAAGTGLNLLEQVGSFIHGRPDRSFMPGDLKAELDASQNDANGPVVKTYKS